MSQVERTVVCLRLCHGKIQFRVLPSAAVTEWNRQRYGHTHEFFDNTSSCLSPVYSYHTLQKNSEAVEDDIVDGGEEENDGLKRPESPKMSRIQKILDSARMGGISGPLVRELFLP